MHLKVFVKLKKTLKTLSSGQKKTKKTQKTPKNPKKPKKTQKTQKNPKKTTGLGFLKKKRVFSNPGADPWQRCDTVTKSKCWRFPKPNFAWKSSL